MSEAKRPTDNRPIPSQDNPLFATWKKPKEGSLGDWLEKRTARHETREYRLESACLAGGGRPGL